MRKRIIRHSSLVVAAKDGCIILKERKEISEYNRKKEENTKSSFELGCKKAIVKFRKANYD